MKKRLFSLFALFLAPFLLLPGCTGQTPEESRADTTADTTEESAPPQTETQAPVPQDSIELVNGVFAAELFSYSGPYVEDGSNEACENVCAVRLINRSGTHYQYLRFRLETDSGTYTFAASTLFAGAEMTVLCEEKTALADPGILSAEILSEAPFPETPSVHTDELRITYTDGYINVKNLTDATLTNVYVYYKTTGETGYFGGITYRAHFEEIAAGQTVQERAANVRRETSAVLFATYDP